MSPRYNDRYTKTLKFDGVEYILKSANGCFWNIFVNDKLVAGNYTKYEHAFSEVMNGEVRDWLLNTAH